MAMIIVNPNGGIHTVEDEHGAELLEKPGYRQADKAEAAAWTKEFGGKASKENSSVAAPQHDDDDLDKKTKQQLVEFAAAQSLAVDTSLNKADLVAAIRAAQAATGD